MFCCFGNETFFKLNRWFLLVRTCAFGAYAMVPACGMLLQISSQSYKVMSNFVEASSTLNSAEQTL
jgi:hypothetical protein